MSIKYIGRSSRDDTYREITKTGRSSPEWDIGASRQAIVSNGFGLLMRYGKLVESAPTKNVNYSIRTGFDNLTRRDHREG